MRHQQDVSVSLLPCYARSVVSVGSKHRRLTCLGLARTRRQERKDAPSRLPLTHSFTHSSIHSPTHLPYPYLLPTTLPFPSPGPRPEQPLPPPLNPAAIDHPFSPSSPVLVHRHPFFPPPAPRNYQPLYPTNCRPSSPLRTRLSLSLSPQTLLPLDAAQIATTPCVIIAITSLPSTYAAPRSSINPRLVVTVKLPADGAMHVLLLGRL